MVGSCELFLMRSESSFLLIGILRPLISKAIIDIIGLISTMFLIVFYLLNLLFISFFPAFLLPFLGLTKYVI